MLKFNHNAEPKLLYEKCQFLRLKKNHYHFPFEVMVEKNQGHGWRLMLMFFFVLCA